MSHKPVDVLVLAGGMATRMGPVCVNIPKALLPVMGTPFAVWQMREVTRTMVNPGRAFFLVRAGFESPFRDLAGRLPIPSHVVGERAPLGTGGAILQALAQKDTLRLSDPFLVVNGDVLFAMRPENLVDAAQTKGTAMQGISVPDASRFGTLDIKDGLLTSFREKTGLKQPGIINAGLYAFTHAALAPFPAGQALSFEKQMAPVLVQGGRCEAIVSEGSFIDIGLPADYAVAEDFIRRYAYEIQALGPVQKAHT